MLNRRKNLLQIEIYRLKEGRDVSFNLIRRIVKRVINKEKWRGGRELSIILTDDCMIQELNHKYLNRNQPTDVITFLYGEEEEGPWGEIYISEDRARDQASEYRVPFQEELYRLIIHGLLHLLGYRDESDVLKRKMKRKENHYLEYFKEHIFNNKKEKI